MMQGTFPQIGQERQVVDLSYKFNADWRVLQLEVTESLPASWARIGRLEVIINVKTKVPASEQVAATAAITAYHNRTYPNRKLTINYVQK